LKEWMISLMGPSKIKALIIRSKGGGFVRQRKHTPCVPVGSPQTVQTGLGMGLTRLTHPTHTPSRISFEQAPQTRHRGGKRWEKMLLGIGGVYHIPSSYHNIQRYIRLRHENYLSIVVVLVIFILVILILLHRELIHGI
jgi:hypothetical protein